MMKINIIRQVWRSIVSQPRRLASRGDLKSGLHTANLSWQTRVGKPELVCVNGTKRGGKHVCKLLASNRNMFTDCFYAVHTHQLESANTSLPTLVCRVKAALTLLFPRKRRRSSPTPFISHRILDLKVPILTGEEIDDFTDIKLVS